ncbi:MAG TPA: hypothetical protein VGI16_03885 [Candidatus Acidoferrum sp.]|jgi:hypothetical protein
MQTVNVFQFYSLGHFVHALSEVKATDKIKDKFYALFSARAWLEFLLNGNLIALNVCGPACRTLVESIKQILDPTVPDGSPAETEPSLDMEKEIGPFRSYSLTSSLSTFETVLSAELQSISTYWVSRKLAYETKLLIEEGDKLLPDNIKAEIPEVAVQELKQAGKCVAFDIPTAAGFHIIRATESVIRKYYSVVVRKPPKPKMRNWGAYIKNLTAAGADTKVTGFLDHIRENYRNPVLHPEETLSSEDAQALLGICVSAIFTMV